jgi:hypothetical protein
MPDVIQKQWDSIKYQDGNFLQIDTQHTLEWYMGYQSISQRILLFVSNTKIGMVEFSKSILTGCRRRELDDSRMLPFELLRNKYQGVFVIICCDIIEYSRMTVNEKETLVLVTSCYKRWNKLFKLHRDGLLDEYSQKGLLGKLLFLEMRIDESDSALTTVQGWSGADSTDQDFMCQDGWYEIKSIGDSASSVAISSLERLGCEDYGELIIQITDKVMPERAGAVLLNDVVCRISNNLVNDIDTLELFHAKLFAYGYIDLQEYSKQKYHYSAMQRYSMGSSFLQLTTKSIPAQIVSLHYELNLPFLMN